MCRQPPQPNPERIDVLWRRRETEQKHAELLALKSQLLLLRMGLLLRRYERALRQDRERGLKAGFRLDQPRWPAGSGRISGRWSGGAGTGGPASDEDSDQGAVTLASHKIPHVPNRRPSAARERNRIARELARYGTEALWEAVAAGAAWLAEEAASFVSYFDSPKSIEELQDAVSYPRPGYDIHHIVEKSSAADDGYPVEMIEAPENLVRIPRWKHWEINSWYQTPNKDFGGMTPRAYLHGKTWNERAIVGHDALRKFGVLKP